MAYNKRKLLIDNIDKTLTGIKVIVVVMTIFTITALMFGE